MESLSREARERIDTRCDEFEFAFFDGGHPSIDVYMEDFSGSERAALFEALLLLEWDCRDYSEDEPKLDEYLSRFQQQESLVRTAWREFKRRQETKDSSQNAPNEDTDLIEQGLLSSRYQIEEEVGKGGFAVVYRAFDTQLQRAVAIKVPSKSPEFDVDSFLNEARTVAKLSHPNLVPIFDSGKLDDGRPFAVMEYLPGKTLADRLQSRPLSHSETAQIIGQVADALHYAHQQGFTHRDLKPSNILLDDKGNARVADFGLALHETEQPSHRGDRSGTPLYRSPEQVRGESDWIDGRSDIWALGSILYRMLVGRQPFKGETARELDEQILHREPKPPRQIDDSIPEWLEDICLRCLSKSPEGRFPTCDSIATAIQRGVARANSRSIEIGRDAIGNTIVSAEGNVVIVQAGTQQVEEPAPLEVDPYKGLASFHEQDADVFFGREQQVERLWDALRDLRSRSTRDQTLPFLAILGPSGCGKSSLARAGLMAELARRPLPGAHDCRVIVLTPGARPLESLATVLAQTVTGDAAPLAKAREFEEELNRENDAGDYDGLRRIIGMLPDLAQSPVMLFVDQFEEIYSLCQSDVERRVFVEQLLCAAEDPASHTSVIISLRSDFIGETDDHQRLNRIVAEQSVLVPAMNDAELYDAIHRPAAEAGFFFEDQFVERLVGQTKGREGALPMLQFALKCIWQGIQDDRKPEDTLRKIGGVGGALAGEAQRVYDSLSPADEKIARRAFLSMVQVGEGTRITRRRATVRSMTTAGDDDHHVHRVLSHFAGADTRLVTLHASSQNGSTSYSAEVTHEALIDHWPLLRDWLEESRDDLRFERRLDAAAQDWKDQGCPEGLLWRTPNLELLRQFSANHELTRAQSDFFLASDELALTEKKRRRQRIRIYQVGSALIGILAVAAMLLGWKFSQESIVAKANAEEATANRMLAEENATAAVETIEHLARAVPRILEMMPEEFAEDARKDLLYTAIDGLKKIGPDAKRKSYVAAVAHRGLGDIYRDADNLQRAMHHYRQTLEFINASREEYADTPWLTLQNLARAEDRMGEAFLKGRKPDEATKHFTKALQHRQSMLKYPQATDDANYGLGGSYSSLGRVLFRDDSKQKEALEYFEKAVEHRKQFSDTHPEIGLARREYGGALYYRGIAKRGLGRYEESAEDIQLAVSILEEVLAKWQEMPGLQGEYLLETNIDAYYTELGATYLLWKKPKEARKQFARAEEKLRELSRKCPRNRAIAARYWLALYGLGTMWLEEDPKRSAELFADARKQAHRAKVGDIRRMLTEARCHNRQKARELAEKIALENADRSSHLYQVACGYALCAWSARTSAQQSEKNTDENDAAESEAAEFSKLALEWLQQAIDKGYSNATELRDNPELDEIRKQPKFQNMLASLSTNEQ